MPEPNPEKEPESQREISPLPSVSSPGETELAEWLAAARAGSWESLGKALEACRGYLLLVAQRELSPELQAKGGASDLVQEALLDAVCDFERFQGTSEEEWIHWLRRLLLNNLIDFVRQYREAAKRQIDREARLPAAGSSLDPLGVPAGSQPSPSEAALTVEQIEAVQRVLKLLPDHYRQVLLWRYQEGRSFEEIGRALALTPNAASKLLVRALRRVQHELGECP